MDRRSPLTSRHRYTVLPALALAALAVAGCSSSGGGATAAPAPTTAASGASMATPTTAPAATATTTTSSTPTAATTPSASGTPAGTGKRPADACTLLTSPQVAAHVGTGGPFRGTGLDPVDGKPVWGCTWGSRQSYASLHEIEPARFANLRSLPDHTATPIPGIGQDAYLLRRGDGYRPSVYFLSGGRAYEVSVVVDRSPDDGVNSAAEATAGTALALILSKQV
ncbi:hypothetical protein ACFCX4_32425 [Kitasatospora sp. NPDC056327]|uniref:hypothetical protein n=1 Tax=Kitasatospora sp. NPDC056327 TaxID=3345785 RepID=UPI0035D565B5